MANEQRVQRFDVGRLDKFEKVAGGGIRVPAFLARTGIQIYRTEDGREIRELRHPDDVFAEDSYKSFEHAPVTDLHPDGLVDTTNRRELSRGHIINVRPDGSRLAGDLLITDAETIRQIEAGERVETSGGYTCVVEETPGVYDGQPYDTRQRQIRGNHAGLGPEGWGRAGPEVGLRIDGGGHQVAPGRSVSRFDSKGTEQRMKKVRIDGVEYDAGSDSHIQAVDREFARRDAETALAKTKHDAAVQELQKQLDETKGRLDGATAKAAKLETDLAAATKRADEAVSPATVDARVAARVELMTRARRVLGAKFDASGKSDVDVMRAVLTKRGAKIAADASEGYLRGRFDSETEKPAEAADEFGGELEEEEETEAVEGDEPVVAADSRRRRSRVRVSVSDGDDASAGGEPRSRIDQIEDANRKWAAGANDRFANRKTRS